jgi:hypothetical protein
MKKIGANIRKKFNKKTKAVPLHTMEMLGEEDV